MYQRILVPLDGSAVAAQVLPHVQELALGLKARVSLVRVIEPVPEDLAHPTEGLYLDNIIRNFLDTAVDELEKTAIPLRKAGVAVSCTAHEGRPAEKILEEASREPETLVAMSTHGRSGIGRWVLGSVTNKVLQAGGRPLLIYRSKGEQEPDVNGGFKTIVLPLDGSAVAEKVMPHAIGMAKALGLSVSLVSAVPADKDIETSAYLKRMGTLLKEQGVKGVQEHLLLGHPAEAVIEFVDKAPGALVAMTTHGRSGVSRWVLGSVTERVVQGCHRPVLVVSG